MQHTIGLLVGYVINFNKKGNNKVNIREIVAGVDEKRRSGTS